MQGKKRRGIHWFDPFGSVKFSDLCSDPLVPWDDKAVRFLFWDQEPLHKTLLDTTLKEFCNMYNGALNLVVSEKNSEFVEYACKTYGFTSHYYFFHGWAALDWYRGYNRSNLMTPPSKRIINKVLISPNRIIGGERSHRVLTLYHLFKNNFYEEHIGCPKICPVEKIDILNIAKKFEIAYPDILEVFNKHKLPKNFADESDHPMHSYCLSLFKESSESLLYLVTETVADGQRLHLTEKIFKPIALQMPFIVVGCQHSLKYLKEYGFKTFETLWSEDYDNEPNLNLRIEKIILELKKLKLLSKKELQDKFTEALPIIKHNYKHFYSGSFERLLWKEMKTFLRILKG